jgi:hypothetical protein
VCGGQVGQILVHGVSVVIVLPDSTDGRTIGAGVGRQSGMASSGIPDQRTSAQRQVVVCSDESHWGRAARSWAARYSALVGIPLDVRPPPSTDRIDALITASRDAELIVLGCRHGMLHGVGIGAAVGPVAELSYCDVVMVGGKADAVRSINRRITVLLGPTTTHTEAGECAVRAACRIALLRNTPIEILRLVHRPVPSPRRHDHHTAPTATSSGTPSGDELAPLNAAIDLVHGLAPTIPVSARLLWAKPHEAVAGIADTDLLVVGADGPLDTLAHAALHHARSPVLVAHAYRRTAPEAERAPRSDTSDPRTEPTPDTTSATPSRTSRRQS